MTDGGVALTVLVPALCALAYLLPLIRTSKRKSLAAVPPAGGAMVEYPLTLIRGNAKCAAPWRAWRPEVLEGGRLSAAASPGNSKVGPPHRTDGASLT